VRVRPNPRLDANFVHFLAKQSYARVVGMLGEGEGSATTTRESVWCTIENFSLTLSLCGIFQPQPPYFQHESVGVDAMTAIPAMA